MTMQPTEWAAGRRPVLHSLTGLRFVACLIVFLVHIAQEGMFASSTVSRDYTSVFWQGGWVGVSFFFVLSGFVLTWTARPDDTPLLFWRRRFVRIYPNHWVTLVATIVLSATAAHEAIDWKSATINAGLIQSWFPAIDIRTGFNGVSWTLACEAFFYVCFPFLVRPVLRIRDSRLWGWTLGMMGVLILIPSLGRLMSHTTTYPMTGLTDKELYVIMQLPPTRLSEFVLGMVLARLIMSGRRIPFGVGTAVAITIAAWGLAPMFPGGFQVITFSAIPVALVVATAAGQDLDGRAPRWVRTPVVLLAGEISFAFYMVHRIVIVFGHLWLGNGTFSTPAAVGILVSMLVVALVLGWALMALVERPLMRRLGSSRSRARSTPIERERAHV